MGQPQTWSEILLLSPISYNVLIEYELRPLICAMIYSIVTFKMSLSRIVLLKKTWQAAVLSEITVNVLSVDDLSSGS